MPNLKRRGFLQLLGAVGLAPFLPAMGARTAVAGGGASVSKALWAGMHANAGSTAGFVGLARNMGLSNAAIQGVGARSIGVRIALATATNSFTRTAAKTLREPVSHGGDMMGVRRRFERALQHYFSDDTDRMPDCTGRSDQSQTEESPSDEIETR